MLSLVSASFVGVLKLPASAHAPKVIHQDVRLEKEQVDLTPPLGSIGQTDRYGFGCVPTRPNECDRIWAQIHKLEGIVLSPDPFKNDRELVIKRAYADMVVSTDEVIVLSNNYRSAGFDSAADQLLGLVIDLLEFSKPSFIKGIIFDKRIGEAKRDIEGFSYSQTRKLDLQKFRTSLSKSDDRYPEAH